MSTKRALYDKLLSSYPITLKATKSKGRHFVAKSQLQPGTTVLVESSCAFVLFKDNARDYCSYCMKRFNRMTAATRPASTETSLFSLSSQSDSSNTCIVCTDCRNQTFWCSESCKKADQAHQLICAAIVELPGIAGMHSVDYALVRLIVQVLANTAVEAIWQMDSSCRVESTPMACISDLLSHQKSYQGPWLNAIDCAAEDIAACLSHLKINDSLKSKQEIIKLACRINSNSHGVYDATGNKSGEIGVGMFPFVAMLNHSCAPNCAFVTSQSGQMLVRTLTQVSPGTELCVGYIDLFTSRWERRGKLLTTKLFWCTCIRCGPRAEETVVLTTLDPPTMDPSVEMHEKSNLWQELQLDGVLCLSCKSLLVPTIENGQDMDADILFRCLSSIKLMGDNPLDKCANPTIYSVQDRQSIFDQLTKYIESAQDLIKIDQLASAKCEYESALAFAHLKLHPNNHQFLPLYTNLVEISMRLSQLDSAIKYSRCAVDHLTQLVDLIGVSRHIPELSDLTCKYAEVLEIAAECIHDGLTIETNVNGEQMNEVNLRELSAKCYTQCLESRLVCYGVDHPKTKLIQQKLL
ncbi:hypothetical protein O5D80_007328 [Batrachochytrium dendrobatidis]|nr:hypothetical protein O5D80_007328 [Batrachochytrium dendrobatidis]